MSQPTLSMTSTNSPSFSLTNSQISAVDHCLRYASVLLIADKGAGKTRTGLAVAWESGGDVLILCPNKVRSGWIREAQQCGVPITLIEGDAQQRVNLLAEGGIMVMGVDLLPWLKDTYKEPPMDGLILDETTRYSKPGAKGTRALRAMRSKLEWVLGLTASPVMEDPLALYGQALVIDGGKALGRSFDRYKALYFMQMDFQGYDWALRPGADKEIATAVRHLVYHMEDVAYEESLVPLREERVEVAGTGAMWRFYEELAAEAYLELGDGIEAANEAVISGKMEQLTQGAVYDEEGTPHWVHFQKFEALDGMLTDEPTIIVYSFQFELAELRRRFPNGRDLRDRGALESFNRGDIHLLFMHPKSGSHGINAQERCCEMICMKPIWSADAWDQVIGRIRRRGQTRECRRRTLVIPGTVDEVILDRVAGKEETGSALLEHIKAVAK